MTMNSHLKNLVKDISNKVNIDNDDFVLDIGCNDGTLLSCYRKSIKKIGVDPIANKIKKIKTPNTKYISNYFSRQLYNNLPNIRKAKIITSISMFYDLDDPMKFVSNIKVF